MNRLIILFIAFTFFSCSPSIPKEKMAEIDSLELKLDSAQDRVVIVDSVEIYQLISDYEERIEFLKSNLKDTLPRKEAYFIDNYFRMRKKVKSFTDNYYPVKNELRISKQQMKDLRFDAENGLVEEKDYDKYIALEKENIEGVTYASKVLLEDYELLKRLFLIRKTRVDSLIETFETKHSMKE